MMLKDIELFWEVIKSQQIAVEYKKDYNDVTQKLVATLQIYADNNNIVLTKKYLS